MSYRNSCLPMILALGLVLCGPTDLAWAQFGGSTTSGTFGSRSIGGSSGLSAGTRSFARGAQTPAAGASQQEAGAGQLTGGERFQRENRQGQFVGSDVGDIGGALGTFGSATGGGVAQFFNQALQRRNPEQANQGRNADADSQSRRRQMRITRRVAFDVPTPASNTVTDALARRLEQSPRIHLRSSVEVDLQGRTAILRGTVATAHDRDLAARVALLEPGISAVDNQLEIESPLPEPGQ